MNNKRTFSFSFRLSFSLLVGQFLFFPTHNSWPGQEAQSTRSVGPGRGVQREGEEGGDDVVKTGPHVGIAIPTAADERPVQRRAARGDVRSRARQDHILDLTGTRSE